MDSNLITVEQIKGFTSISSTMDCQLLEPHILIGQQLYTQEILGDPLYNQILQEYDNNTLSGNTLTLYNDYIVAAIAFSAWYSASPFLAYRTNRNGINTTSSPDSVALTPEELSLYITRVQNFMNFYLKRLQTYLDTNAALFPNYRSADSQEISKGGGLYLNFKSRNSNCDGW